MNKAVSHNMAPAAAATATRDVLPPATEATPPPRSAGSVALALSAPALHALASLRLTVTLFALSAFLIFAGTLAQVDQGIWQVMEQYFRCAVAWVEIKIFFPRSWDVLGWINFKALMPRAWDVPEGIAIPFPGGWTLGTLLLANLLAAHALRFKIRARGWKLLIGLIVTVIGIGIVAAAFIGLMADMPDETGLMWTMALQAWVAAGLLAGSGMTIAGCVLLFAKRAGIVLLHAGIIVMLLSELITGLYAVEANMSITEGTFANYAADFREVELAVIDPTHAEHDQVLAVRQSMIDKHLRQRRATGGSADALISDATLPFDIRIEHYFENAALTDSRSPQAAQAFKPDPNLWLEGMAKVASVIERAPGTGTDSGGEVDTPAAYVTLLTDGKSRGTYLLWSQFTEPRDTVLVGDSSYKIALRFRRHYKPYEMHLIDVRHDKFVGTEIPRNFSSKVRLIDPERNEDREVLIYMNHPLRYRGETFFQSQVQQFATDASGKMVHEATVLQVVRNPAWLWPYIACAMVAAGMLVHFGTTLTRFLGKVMA